MITLLAIAVMGWFVGWAVTLDKTRDLIVGNPTRYKIAAVLCVFVMWPLLLLDVNGA